MGVFLGLGFGLVLSGCMDPEPPRTTLKTQAPPPEVVVAAEPPGPIELGATPSRLMELVDHEGTLVRRRSCDGEPGTLEIQVESRLLSWSWREGSAEYTVVSAGPQAAGLEIRLGDRRGREPSSPLLLRPRPDGAYEVEGLGRHQVYAPEPAYQAFPAWDDPTPCRGE